MQEFYLMELSLYGGSWQHFLGCRVGYILEEECVLFLSFNGYSKFLITVRLQRLRLYSIGFNH